MAHKATRSAVTGEFVSPRGANPDTTVTETIRTPEDREAELRALVDAFLAEIQDRFDAVELERIGIDPPVVAWVIRQFERYAVGQIHDPQPG